MSLALLAYLVFHVPVAINNLAGLVFIITILWYAILGMCFMFDDTEDENGTILKLVKGYPYKSVVAFLLVATFIPNQDNMKIIVGAHMTQVVAENIVEIEGVRQVPENLVRFINEKLVLQEEPVETVEE